MIKYILSQKVHLRSLIGIGFCFLIFLVGYYILGYISTEANPPFGDTIYILIGSTFMFTSIVVFVLILRYLYYYKKKKEKQHRKRKSHKLFYLRDVKKKGNSDSLNK